MADKTTTTEKKQVRAHARFIQVSPQKMRLVADMIRNESVELALEQLRFSSKKAALPMTKLINSAIANATHNFNLTRENLYIKALSVDGGPVLKRFKPRAMGSPSAIHKRTSHINVVLEERKRTGNKPARSVFQAIRPKKSSKVLEHEHDHEHDEAKGSVESGKSGQPKQSYRSEEKKKQSKISLKRRLFNRKSGE
jgi:large subunit ribosomal protein L22